MAEIIYGMSNEEYHAHPALGSSGMKKLLISPAHYYEHHLNPEHVKDEPTAALKFGSLYDCLVLEPEQFDDRYVMEEKHDRRSKEGKAAAEEYDAKCANKCIVKQADYDVAIAMKEKLMAHPLSFIIEEGIKQASIFWNDPVTGILCKCRPDIMLEPGKSEFFPNGVMLDLKSAADASAEGFGKQIFNLGYQISAAHYLTGFKRAFELPEEADVPWYWVVSEKSAPYLPVYRPITHEQLLHGKHYAAKAIRISAEAMESGNWQGYPDSPEPAITPGWIQKEINQIIEGEI